MTTVLSMDKTFLTEEEFEELLSWAVDSTIWIDDDILTDQIGKKLFTDDQLKRICSDTFDMSSDMVETILCRPEIAPHHIDLVLKHGTNGNINCVFVVCQHLTPEQIDIGVRMKIRYALRRQECTEEQKVKYHLMWG